MIRWLMALGLVLFPAWAQQPQAPRTLTITLTQDEAQFVLNKLAEYPWKDVNPVISKIINQLNIQMMPLPPPKEAKPNE